MPKTTATATATAAKSTKSVKNAKTGKAAKKGSPKAKTASKPRGESVRERALKALKNGDEMKASEVQAKIGLGHGLKPTLDQEVERGHLTYADAENSTYKITAAGKKALENGTVNPRRAKKAE